MIKLVVSGGQTGADQAGWRAAKASGIPTGGWMPKGFKTEDGDRPEFAERYGARAHDSASYRDRTISNIGLADATLLFGDPGSPGGKLALASAKETNQPLFLVMSSTNPYASGIAKWIKRYTGIESLNVAGNRESSAPGIGYWVEKYLIEVFKDLNQS